MSKQSIEECENELPRCFKCGKIKLGSCNCTVAEEPQVKCSKFDCSKHNEGYGLPCDDDFNVNVSSEPSDWETREREAFYEKFPAFTTWLKGSDQIADYLIERITAARKEALHEGKIAGMNNWLKFQDLFQDLFQEGVTSERERCLQIIEGMKIECPNHTEEGVECYGYDEQVNQTLSTASAKIKEE